MIKKCCSRYKQLPIPVKASLWFVICAILQKGIGTITTPIFTRIMTPNEFGQFNVFTSWQGIISVFVTMNLYGGVFAQGVVKFAKERAVFVSTLQGLCLALCVLWSVIYLLAESFWNQIFGLTTVQMMSMLLIIWLSAVWGFWSMTQRVDFLYRKVVKISLIMSILTPALGIFMVLNADDKVTARILSMVIVQLLLYTGLFLKQMHQGKTFCSKRYWRYALAFNIPLIPHYLSGVVLSSSDRIMIQQMVGAAEAGIYSLGCSVALVMSLFNSSLLQTLEPWLYRKISEGKILDIPPVAYTSFVLIAGLNIILIAFAPELVAIFAPPAYYEAIWIIPPVTIGVYFTFTYSFFATFEFYFEKTRFIAIATVAGAVVNLGLNYLLIPYFGYVTAGYTTMICYIIYAVSHYIFMQRVVREKFASVKIYNLPTIAGITIFFMVMAAIFAFTYEKMIVRYSFLLIILAFCYIKRQLVIDKVHVILLARKQVKE
ncbi:lipopolysaccharide biosynthesis protein [Selenomonas ruminantium]|uniref:lipopolysaccharide biosynthesis protein n=1 Tax=Selenomonas ruminantium TaxID=971 RepID=UPI00041BB9D2|nr:oligosaccharide flippase family protein [Selenomonas ruminantium]